MSYNQRKKKMQKRSIVFLILSTLWTLSTLTPETYACSCNPPKANFTGPDYVCINCNATFTCTSTDAESAISSRSWSASGGAPATGSGSTFTTKWSSPGTKSVSLTVRDSDASVGCPPNKSDNDSKTVTVIEVDSLVPDEGTEVDDGDSNPNTRSFVVGIADTGVVTVTATPNPSVSEEDLPACWMLTGGTGSGKLERTVDRTTTGVTTITCTAGSSSKTTKIYVVEVGLSAYDLDGSVAESDEEDPGAFVHFNLDNDNDSNNTPGSPKRPGADYLETTNSVTGENDLESLKMSLTPLLAPSLDFGSVVLSTPGSAKIWKTGTKGSSNLLVPADGNKTWDLSDPDQKDEFLSLSFGVSLFVEGINTDTGNITLTYKASDNDIHSDSVKYTFIAADCGRQPKTDSPDERTIAESIGNLTHCEWSITDDTDTPPYYNCIAYSVGETTNWYSRTEGTMAHQYDIIIDVEWGNNNGIFEILEDLDPFYDAKGYVPSAIQPPSEPTEDVVIMYYSGFHAAREKSCSCGAGKWIMFESKCGEWVRMEHVWDQLNGGIYGSPTRYYKCK